MAGSSENGKKEWETADREMGCLSIGMWGQEKGFPLSVYGWEKVHTVYTLMRTILYRGYIDDVVG